VFIDHAVLHDLLDLEARSTGGHEQPREQRSVFIVRSFVAVSFFLLILFFYFF
jgi:hypothetical protein